MPELQLGLGVWHGHYQDLERLWLRWYDESSHWLPTFPENVGQQRARVEQAEKRAKQAQSQVEQDRQQTTGAQQRAEQEWQRAEGLAARRTRVQYFWR